METHQRPGVYSDYTLSSAWSTVGSGGVVGLVGLGAGEAMIRISTVGQAEEKLSAYPTLRRLALVILRSGGTVILSPAAAGDKESYSAALDRLLLGAEVDAVVLDSEVTNLQLALKEKVEAYSGEGNECLGIIGLSDGTVDTLTTRALVMNSPRMVLVGGTATLKDEESISGGIYAAAAVAGFVAGEEDPALPVSGGVLEALGSVAEKFTEDELDDLILGGVTILENMEGSVEILRGVTTCTTIEGVSDSRYRELSTIRIIDHVVPGIRRSLKSRFLRKKNNAATRGAIGDQVAVELERFLKQEIIDSYGDIQVEVSLEDPTVCVVAFTFAVTHGLGRIFLTAHITV